MQRYWRDVVFLGFLIVLPLLLFFPVSIGNKTLLPVDALYQFEPYRSGATIYGNPTAHNPLLLDLVLENLVWKMFFVDTIRAGNLPLWNPYQFTGQPFLANGQHSALYPLTWIFFLIPLPRAFGVFMVIQLAIAGMSMYIFGRIIQSTRFGAFIAGCVFQLSGFLIVSVVHPMIVAAASWLPLLLALIDLTIRRASFFNRKKTMLPWALLGAVVMGTQVLAGHAEMTYFTLLVTSAFSGWRIIYTAIRIPKDKWLSQLISPIIGIVIIVCLGLCLGAVQLIPFYEVVTLNFRQGAVSLPEVLEWAYPKRRLITFFIPNFFGNPTHRAFYNILTGEVSQATKNAYGDVIQAFDWGIKNYVEGGVYIGILPLLLALIAVIKPRSDVKSNPSERRINFKSIFSDLLNWITQPYVPFLTFLSMFSLGCIFGTPIYGLIYVLPFFNQSHSPFRWVFPLTVALSALVGLGITRLMNLPTKHRANDDKTIPRSHKNYKHILKQIFLLNTTPSIVSTVASFAVWSGIILLCATWITRWRFATFEPMIEQLFWSLAKAPQSFPDHRTFYAYLFPLVNKAGALLVASGLVLRLSASSLSMPQFLSKRPIWEGLLVVLVLLDLITFGLGFNPASDPQLLDYKSPVVEFLQTDRGLWRMSAFDPNGLKTFNSNVGMLFGFQDIRGYDSIFSAQYARYMGWIEPQNELPYNRIASFSNYSSLDSPLTDLLNVKYIVTEVEIPLPKYKLVFEAHPVRVYENLGNMPRSFSLPYSSTLFVKNGDAVGTAILENDPRYYAIVENIEDESTEGWIGPQPENWSPLNAPQPAQWKQQSIVSYTSNEVIIDVEVDQPCWLILADAYYPGWKAFKRPLGGEENQEKEIGIARIAGQFRGIQLDKSATIRFKYSPNSVKMGAFASFLSGMTIILLAVMWTWRLIYREKAAHSTAKRLAKNSIAPILLSLFNRVLDFAIAALTLRILGPENAGDYTLAISAFMWFDIITNFGLNTYLTREVSRHPDQTRRYLLNTTLIRLGLGFAALPLFGTYIGLRQTVFAAFNSPASFQTIISMLLLYVGLIPNSVSTGLSALFYAYEKAEYPAVTTSISTILKVTIQFIILVSGLGVIGLAGAAIVVNIITLCILGLMAWHVIPAVRGRIQLWKTIKQTSEHALRKGMVKESWPLMVNHLLANAFYKIDILLMDIILGSAAIGFYSIGYKLLDALVVIPSMFTLALFPIISKQALDNRNTFTRFYQLGTKVLLVIVMPASIITILMAKEMVLILGGKEYIPGAVTVLQLIIWSMPLSWFNGLTQYVLIALNKQRFLTRAYILGFSVSFLSNLVLMGRFGYTISAVLHIFAEGALMCAFLFGIRKYLGKIPWVRLLSRPVIAALISGIFTWILVSFGRGVALAGFLISYPSLIWLLKVFSREEQNILAPRLRT